MINKNDVPGLRDQSIREVTVDDDEFVEDAATAT